MREKLKEKGIAHQIDFSLRLARRVAFMNANNSNLVFSPLSIHTVLSLIAVGSNGSTLKEFFSILGTRKVEHLNDLYKNSTCHILAKGSANGGPHLCSSNRVWVRYGLEIKKKFQKTAEIVYGATVDHANFRSSVADFVKEVDSWVQNVTNGVVSGLLLSDLFNRYSGLLFASVLYFKGEWEEEFDVSETRHYDFYLLSGRSIEITFMTSKNKHFLAEYDNFKVLRLPYKQGKDWRKFFMYVFLPNARDGLWKLYNAMVSEDGFLNKYNPLTMVRVRNFMLPRFKISFVLEASEVLENLGMKLPFNSTADLSKMVNLPEGGVTVSSILQKSVLEVDEKGTETGSALENQYDSCSVSPLPMDFVADHPFVFLIKEETTGVVIFAGHLLNPSTA